MDLLPHDMFVVSTLITGLLSALALGPTPGLLPLVGLVAFLRVLTRIVVPRPHPKAKLALLWAAVTIGSSLAFGGPGASALSSIGASIVTLAGISGAISSISLAPFVFTTYTDKLSGGKNPFVFPVVWATWWWGWSRINPVGRIGTWSPLLGLDSYSWLLPHFGVTGVDWVVGAWAEVVASVFIHLVLMPKDPDSSFDQTSVSPIPQVAHERPLIDLDDPSNSSTGHEQVRDRQLHTPSLSDVSSHHPNDPSAAEEGSRVRSSARAVWYKYSPIQILFGILCAAAIPSIYTNNLPLPVVSDGAVRLGVACALPEITNKQSPIDDYIADTQRLGANAKLVLWPEGAISFDSTKDRELKLQRIQQAASRYGIWIGVSFTEPSGGPVPGQTNRRKNRNGIILINNTGVVYEYDKRNLVPITESFSQEAGQYPPTLYNISVPASKDHRNDRHMLPLTAEICLDFAYPFPTIPGKPALVLAPARTWHVNVGRAMYEQARIRANELGSIVLWCDGGEGGLSGVMGLGHQTLRRGAGSWAEPIGIEWPFDYSEDGRTLYGRWGASSGLALGWAAMGVKVMAGRWSPRAILKRSGLVSA